MPTTIEPVAPETLAAADLRPRGAVYPSPADWRDQVVYFLLPDRLSDGGEGDRTRFDRADPARFQIADHRAWMAAGTRFQGGTLQGVAQKLDYLRELGITTLWVGPVWRQRPDLQTYHGYGIQDFLDVDPRFGTRQDLRDLVDAAHGRGMYVLLDVVINHSGNNWFYSQDSGAAEQVPYCFAPRYPLGGWRSATGGVVAAIGGRGDGVWPREFQDPGWYTRAGRIGAWDPAPGEDALDPNAEFRRGDFFDLKDLQLNELEARSQEVLSGLARAYRSWIALSDCDGFRLDTVKHVSFEAARNFCGAIREYAETIGKENFLLLGEVTGGDDMERNYLDVFGRNIDAALDIGAPAQRLAGLVKGLDDPAAFFDQFGGHDLLGSHREVGRYHVSILDDHDMVGRPRKARFAAGDDIPSRYAQVAHAVGVQLTTLGIPCLYYGTEQTFDGTEARHDPAIEPLDEHGNVPAADRYIREAMFGGSFGAFATAGCHFFDPSHPTYRRIAALARLRGRQDLIGLALRRGRQYRRETTFLSRPFGLPGAGELVAWSRVLFDQEVVVAVNSHGTQVRGAEVTVDAGLHPPGSILAVRYRGDWTDAQLVNTPEGETVPIRRWSDGRTTVRLDLPPAGMAVLA
ncbi:MAG: alpha-amylase family glycosyl hydrolase [Chloroflexota bacterium]